MGEEAIDAYVMVENYTPRVELKRSHECIIDGKEEEDEHPNKKLAIEFNCNLDCVIDTNLNNNLEIDKILSKLESVESVLNASTNKEDSSNQDRKSIEYSEVVSLNTKSAIDEDNCLNKCNLDSIEVDEIDATEADNLNKKPIVVESSIDQEFHKLEFTCSPDCVLDVIEAENQSKMSTIKTSNNDDSSRVEFVSHSVVVETTNENPAKESSNDKGFTKSELKSSHECTEKVDLNVKPTMEFSNDENSSRVELKCRNECVEDVMEVEIPNQTPANELLNDENSTRVDLKSLNECDVDATEVDSSVKRLPKEFSNESRSEVLNPNVSPKGNSSSNETVSSQHVDACSKSGCGDITPSRAGDSNTGIADKEECCANDIPTSLSKSQVILEGPKDDSTSGVKKIIFTFNKCGDGNDSIHPSDMEVGNNLSVSHSLEETQVSSFGKSNGVLESYPKNVKKLLSSGIIEGLEVKYINQEKEFLRGIIKGCGYLCGCNLCDFSKVLNAYEFEQHAGCTTKHPNDHIFLNNGISLNSIVQQLKTTPISLLERKVRALVGSLLHENPYLEREESPGTENFQKIENQGEIDNKSHLSPMDSLQSTVSCSSEDTEDTLGSASRAIMARFPTKHKISTVQGITQSRMVPKKLKSSNTTSGHVKKRDNDLHRLLFMPNGLPDGAELAYYSKGQRVLDGYKQGNGIVCSHCDTEVSPSQFEAHAGCAAKRQPYRHIFTTDRVSLHDIALSLAKGEPLTISNSDDTCTVCGDGGKLLICDSCSHAFHEACLDVQSIPEGEWYCSYCKYKNAIGGRVASGAVKPITIRLTRVKDKFDDSDGCVICRHPDFIADVFDEQTVVLCDQCEKEYHIGCLWRCGMSDMKVKLNVYTVEVGTSIHEELPDGLWFCCDYCKRIHATLQNIISTGAKAIPASMLETINRKRIEKGLVQEVGNDMKWQLLSGKFGVLEEHYPLLSSAVTIFRDSFDPIEDSSGRDLIPPMVWGQEIQGQNFWGMYCAVLSVKSVVVSVGLLRIFGQEVAELPLVATTQENQGKGYFQVLFACIMKLLCFLNVEKLVLPAAKNAVSIWTNKFGFKKMSNDQYLRYSRCIDLVAFRGTQMLERVAWPGKLREM